MLASFLFTLREGLEAALIIGIVLGTLDKIHRSEMKPTVWLGAGSAIIVSLLTALVLNWIGASFEGTTEEVFEGITMLLAAGVLTWMIFWMYRQAKNQRVELAADVRRAAMTGGKQALFSLAFLAVVREGIELALFLTATAFVAESGQLFLGIGLGFATVIVLSWALFKGLVQLNLGRFFMVTSILLILFAAGLVAHSVHEFNEAGWIPSVIEHVWDINHILDENSIAGQILKALFGYNGNPSLTEVLAYLSYFAIIGLSLWRVRRNEPLLQKA